MPRKVTPQDPFAEVAAHRQQLELQFQALVADLTERVDQDWPMAYCRVAAGVQTWYQQFKQMNRASQPGAATAIDALECTFELDDQLLAKLAPAQDFLQLLDEQARRLKPALPSSQQQLEEAKRECVEYGQELQQCHKEVQMHWLALQDHPSWRFQDIPGERAPLEEFDYAVLMGMGRVSSALVRFSMENWSPQWSAVHIRWNEMTSQILAARLEMKHPATAQERELRLKTWQRPKLSPELLREKQLAHLQQESDAVQASLLEVALDLLTLQFLHGQAPTEHSFHSSTRDFWWCLEPARAAGASADGSPQSEPGEVDLVGVVDL